MYSAPSVSFPVGRSLFLAGLLLFIWLLGGIAVFLGSTAMEGLRWAGLWLAWLTSGACAAHWWHRLQMATIHWDGQTWLLKETQSEVAGDVSVRLDLQAAILLRLQSVDSGRRVTRWAWAEARSDQRRWGDLRRALYAPRRLDAIGMAVHSRGAHE